MRREYVVNMRIERIDDALEQCRVHLEVTDIANEKIENLLTPSILILICAEFERRFRDLVVGRCSSVSDRPVRKYVESYNTKEPRSLRVVDVKALLVRFGSSHKDEFARRLKENPVAESMYSSILTNRNSVAHGKGSNVTLGDIERYYEGGHVVLDYFQEALRASKIPSFFT